MEINCLFKLREPGSNKPNSIRLLIYHKAFKPYGVLYYGTGLKIHPRYFDTTVGLPILDKSKLREIDVSNRKGQKQLNSISREEMRDLWLIADRLNNIRSAAHRVWNRLELLQQAPDTESFRLLLDAELGKGTSDHASDLGSVKEENDLLEQVNVYADEFDGSKVGMEMEHGRAEPVKVYSLNEYVRQYTREVKEGKRLTSSGKVMTEGSYKNYLTFEAQFLLYQKSLGRKLDFKHINQEFYNGFVRFLNAKNYSPNTIGKHIARLKKILRSAKEEGLYEGEEHEKKYFRTLQQSTEHIYLSTDELQRLQELDLSQYKEMDLYRDVFLIGCHAAQRISDYKSIRPEHIAKTSKGVSVLKLIQKKTGEEVMIPINTSLNNLLKKYNYMTPKIYEQKLNDLIKEIAKKAGIDTKIEIEMVRGGKKERKVFFKYELIKSHTARRTGATNMYLAGVPSIDIMKLTGHKKESNFLKYICISREETADKLAAHPFFK